MKTVWVFVVSVLLLAACEYKAPLTTEHRIPIDPQVLGLWQIIPEENENDDTFIRIFKFSDTEYTLQYHEHGGDFYFRAYAINIGGVSAVQLELVGTDDGPVKANEDDRYHVVAYHLENQILKISSLNSELVDDELPDSESLRKAFIQHKENPGLFNDPGVFKRMKSD